MGKESNTSAAGNRLGINTFAFSEFTEIKKRQRPAARIRPVKVPIRIFFLPKLNRNGGINFILPIQNTTQQIANIGKPILPHKSSRLTTSATGFAMNNDFLIF